MNTFSRITIGLLLIMCTIILNFCYQSSMPPTRTEGFNQAIERTLDSLHVKVLSVSASYDGMPTYPPRTPKAGIKVVLTFWNSSSTIIDSLLILRGAVLNPSSDTTFLNFHFTDIIRGIEDWNGQLKPNQIDTIRCYYSFLPSSLLPCGDFMIVRVQLDDRHSHSLFIDSPMFKYSCSQ